MGFDGDHSECGFAIKRGTHRGRSLSTAKFIFLNIKNNKRGHLKRLSSGYVTCDWNLWLREYLYSEKSYSALLYVALRYCIKYSQTKKKLIQSEVTDNKCTDNKRECL